jgi:SagB-type dehydrogenase family enzyme
MNNPLPKKSEDMVETFNYPVSATILFGKPAEHHMDYFELTRLRKSVRDLSALSIKQLGDLLWFAAKIIHTHVQTNGYILTSRPSPSAGARHPVDLLIITPSQSNVVSYYNPFEHSLNELKLDEGLTSPFIDHINESLPIGDATIIWLIAHSDRTAAKYTNPESLIWRDAGALLQSIQMTCTALGIGSCPIGSLAEPFISQLFNPVTIISAGGIIIGNNLVL